MWHRDCRTTTQYTEAVVTTVSVAGGVIQSPFRASVPGQHTLAPSFRHEARHSGRVCLTARACLLLGFALMGVGELTNISFIISHRPLRPDVGEIDHPHLAVVTNLRC